MQGNQLFGVNKIECLQTNTVMSFAGSVTSRVLGMLASIAACNKYLEQFEQSARQACEISCMPFMQSDQALSCNKGHGFHLLRPSDTALY